MFHILCFMFYEIKDKDFKLHTAPPVLKPQKDNFVRLTLRWSILLFLLPLLAKPQADTASGSSFLLLSAGSGSLATFDEMMSPLAYKGIVYGPSIGYAREFQRSFFSIGLQYAYGKTKSSAHPDLTRLKATGHFIEIAFSYLRKSNSSKTWPLYLGVSWNSMLNARNHPWLYVYGEMATGICADLLMKRPFSIGRHGMQISYHATLPLANLIVVPSYAYSPPEPFQDQNAHYRKGKFRRGLKSLEPAWAWDFFRFQNTFALEKEIRGCNRLFAAYDFMLLAHNKPEKVRVAKSFVRIGLKVCL